MVREAMEEAGLCFSDLDRIAVTVGPGSFTGLRVGIAFAKGLALAADAPAVGIGTLEALVAGDSARGRKTAVIEAGRGGVWLQPFDGQIPLGPPQNLLFEEADLTTEERDMLRKRDWRALIHYGVIFFLLEKLGAVIGTTNLHIYAAMRGQSLEDFQKTRNSQILYSVAGDIAPAKPA